MKAWRNKQNQDKFRRGLKDSLVGSLMDKTITLTQFNEQYRDLNKARVGKKLRDNYTRILPAPSFLVTGLLHRAGVYGDPVVEQFADAALAVTNPGAVSPLSRTPGKSVLGSLRKLLGL